MQIQKGEEKDNLAMSPSLGIVSWTRVDGKQTTRTNTVMTDCGECICKIKSKEPEGDNEACLWVSG